VELAASIVTEDEGSCFIETLVTFYKLHGVRTQVIFASSAVKTSSVKVVTDLQHLPVMYIRGELGTYTTTIEVHRMLVSNTRLDCAPHTTDFAARETLFGT
jgi:hypothetical protein